MHDTAFDVATLKHEIQPRIWYNKEHLKGDAT